MLYVVFGAPYDLISPFTGVRNAVCPIINPEELWGLPARVAKGFRDVVMWVCGKKKGTSARMLKELATKKLRPFRSTDIWRSVSFYWVESSILWLNISQVGNSTLGHRLKHLTDGRSKNPFVWAKLLLCIRDPEIPSHRDFKTLFELADCCKALLKVFFASVELKIFWVGWVASEP